MSNYYEILGVWRDASPQDIELAAQTLSEHWQEALALHDPLASDWLQIVEQARMALLNPETRAVYDEQIAAPEEEAEEIPVVSPGFPWRPYLCALLSVPVLLAGFLLVLAAIANSGNLTDAGSFRDALLTTMIVASAVAFPCGLIVLLLADRGRKEQHRLRLLQLEEEVVDPATRARIEVAGRMSEYTDAAVWVTWGAELVVVALWVWLAVLVVAGS